MEDCRREDPVEIGPVNRDYAKARSHEESSTKIKYEGGGSVGVI